MKTVIQLRDLELGKTDAKNELIETDEKSVNRFLDSFLVPDNISPSEFINGKRYYITGLKGTGKTALLRYIGIEAQRTHDAHISYILFKSDFAEEDKAAFSRAANTYVVNNSDTIDSSEEDFVNVWMWFIHRQIVREAASGKLFFAKNDDWDKYSKCVSAPKLGNEEAGIKRYFPKFKQGRVEIEGDLEFLRIKLGFDIDEGDQVKKVKFSGLVKQANELFKKLSPTTNKYLLFIDELELSLGKNKQYQKDVQLIRDLIIAIDKFNALTKERSYTIHVIAAIRSEVITSIESTGKEINKPFVDFGTTLRWQTKSADVSKNHPLIKIINKKIQAAERYIGLQQISSDDQVWERYFPARINDKPIFEFILNKTWYRPRDIVRLLSIAQQQYPDDEVFSQQIFEGINKEYSRQCWVEQTEELNSNFTKDEIDAIKKILSAISCPFSFVDITKKADAARNVYSEVDKLLTKHRIGDILSHLFKLGIIGNTGVNMRFAFRGDDELIIENNMTVHNPLWNFLSVVNKYSGKD